MIRQAPLSAALALLALSGAPAQAAAPAYTIAGRVSLPQTGKARALALDNDARRLYIAGADGIDVLDADSAKATGGIAIAGGAGGVVLAPGLGRGFASDSTGGRVVIFDLTSLKTLGSVAVGTMPAALAFDAANQRVFVANAGDASITAIDAAKGIVIGTAKLPGRPGALSLNPYGSLFASMPGSNQIAVIGTIDVAYRGAIPVSDGDDCSGLALDPVGRRLFVGCANGVLDVIDTDNDFAFEHLSGAKGASAAIFIPRPDGKDGWKGLALFTHGDGTLSLVKMEAFIRYSLGGEVKLEPGIGPVAFDPKTHRILAVANPASGSSELLLVSH